MDLSDSGSSVMKCKIGEEIREMELNYQDYDKECEELYERIRVPVKRALSDAKLKLSDIDKIVLVGGGTKLTGVRSFVSKLFHTFPDTSINPDEAIALGAEPKKVSNWLMGETMRLMKEKSVDATDLSFSAENLVKLIKLNDSKEINNAVAKEVFEKVFEENIDPEQYVKDNNLSTKADSGELLSVVLKAIEANPKAVEDYKAGKKKAAGAMVGFVMKEMKGKCDPATANKRITEELDKML